MNIYSKIRIIFTVAILFVTAFFGSFFYIQKDNHLQQVQKRYIQTAFYVNRYINQNGNLSLKEKLDDPKLKLFLKESDFTHIENPKTIQYILQNGHTVLERGVDTSNIKMIGSKGIMHLYIKNGNIGLLLRDKHPVTFPWHTLFWYIVALLFLALLYLWLTNSLKPLRRLQSQIQKVAGGDLSVSVKSNGKDEVAQVANALDDALRKLESLINSRQLFLRSIMHELKTPIAKGRLLSEFIESSKHKEEYDSIFERLELLIEEFSKIEQMLSSSYKLKLANYQAIDIVEQALELMILSEEETDQRIELKIEGECRLYTDFDLLSLAIKNLIDNAIKYSPDHKVSITMGDTGITIANKGAKFTDSLEPYKEPFHDQKHGLGLGLYIVQSIIQMLSLKIEYLYSDGENIFIIKADR